MADPNGRPERFECTPAGSVARARRRLGGLLAALTLLMLAVAVGTLAAGRVGAGLVALLVALGPLLAGLLMGGGAVEYLDLRPGALTLGLRRGPETVPLEGAHARRLTPEEIAHLEGLAASAGLVAGVGSFDSRRLGEVELHATDLAHAVLVVAGERRLVVTPDEPERFCRALSRKPAPAARADSAPH